MGSGPFPQTLCFAIALMFAREFARERRGPAVCCPHLPESQEQAELSPLCVTPEVQGWSHLGLIAGVLVGLIAGVSLTVFVGLKYRHFGSARSLQLAVANEVSVTSGGDSAGAAHRRRRGRGILEDSQAPELEACSSTRKPTAGLKGCWCRGSAVSVCASHSLPHSVIVLTLWSRSTPLWSVSTWIAFEGWGGLVPTCSGGSKAPRPQSSQLGLTLLAAGASVSRRTDKCRQDIMQNHTGLVRRHAAVDAVSLTQLLWSGCL